MKLSFNTTGNSQTSGRTTQAIIGLGSLRNTKGSLTRKFKYCNKINPNVVFQCVFNQSLITTQEKYNDGQVQSIACQDGYVLVSYDYGNTFNRVSAPSDNLFLIAISKTGEYQLTIDSISGDQYSIYNSVDFGRTFKPINGFTNEAKFISLGISGTGKYQSVISEQYDNKLYVSSDYGNNFALPENPPTFAPNQTVDVSVSDSGQYQSLVQITGVATPSQVILSSDYGKSWNNIVYNINATLFSGTISGDGSTITCGTLTPAAGSAEIHYSTNYGVSWQTSTITGLNLDIPPSIFAISTSYTGQYQLMTGGFSYGQLISQSRLYLSTDNGATFNPITLSKIIAPYNYSYWLSVSISNSGRTMTAITSLNVDSAPPLPNIPSGPYYYFKSFDFGINWQYKEIPYPINSISIS